MPFALLSSKRATLAGPSLRGAVREVSISVPLALAQNDRFLAIKALSSLIPVDRDRPTQPASPGMGPRSRGRRSTVPWGSHFAPAAASSVVSASRYRVEATRPEAG